MKKRQILIYNIKDMYKQYSDVVKTTLLVIIEIALFIVGYLVGKLVITRDMKIEEAVFIRIIIGFLFVYVPALIVTILSVIYETLND